jgi:hypothetical protein
MWSAGASAHCLGVFRYLVFEMYISKWWVVYSSLELLWGWAGFPKHVRDFSQCTVYTALRNNALRAPCAAVCVLVALRVVWTVFLLTRIELAIK